ncbi:expressed unknown protein [Seminavis robusta]|uniref:Uncharacterized protein n=1 Tax=Seminavis robusta TaxID=568900 RepID=A0A9N8EGD2_9STRA|nr:expressed unknown protein [Seminavis robusta]|eukprot:Sro1150_g246620.1 n/a (208) ;mRNA; f:3194-3817
MSSIAAPNVVASFACRANADCNFVIYEALHDAAFLHRALQMAKKFKKTSHSTTNNNDPNRKPKNPGKESLRGRRQSVKHFCQTDGNDDDFLQRYHCGDTSIDPNNNNQKIQVCHFNGVDFTTMCVRPHSALFRNLHARDYCGPCSIIDTEGGGDDAMIHWHGKKPSMGMGVPQPRQKTEQRQRPRKPRLVPMGVVQVLDDNNDMDLN